MNKICFGCGSILQSTSEDLPGFIPEEKLNDAKYCKRCFRLVHYGDTTLRESKKSNESIINNVNNSDGLKVFIIDLLNINKNTMTLFNDIKGDKLLLISKCDLIDKSININNIISNIKYIYKINCDIKLISSKDNEGINSFINYLKKKEIERCYILGPTNSGKSTFINKLLDSTNKNLNKLTVSNKRNTTLDFIRLNIENITIIDSPGFIIDDYNLESKYKNKIKPITFNMKENEVLKIDDFYMGFKNNTNVTIYCYEKLPVKKYFKEVNFAHVVDVDSNSDITINGLGIIKIKNSCSIGFNNISSDLISTNKSIMGGKYE